MENKQYTDVMQKKQYTDVMKKKQYTDASERKETVVYNVSRWIEENQQSFLPPICNKMMHGGGQIDVMFIGGPNNRKDYHIEGGEELFYQLEGDMVLKVLERGQHKDVIIKEGEIFLLPRAIPHSPQRYANTVGLVIERQRHELEQDGLRYFLERDGVVQKETLYEVWFSWRKQSLPELIQQYYNSEEYKSGKPLSTAGTNSLTGTNSKDCQITIDVHTQLHNPFSLKDWIQAHRKEIDILGKLPLFETEKHQMQVYMYGKGNNTDFSSVAEIWIWQMNGESDLTCTESVTHLKMDDSVLIPVGCRFSLQQKEGSLAFVVYQDPTKSPAYPLSP